MSIWFRRREFITLVGGAAAWPLALAHGRASGLPMLLMPCAAIHNVLPASTTLGGSAAGAVTAARLLCAIDAPGARRNDRNARDYVGGPFLCCFICT